MERVNKILETTPRRVTPSDGEYLIFQNMFFIAQVLEFSNKYQLTQKQYGRITGAIKKSGWEGKGGVISVQCRFQVFRAQNNMKY